MPRKPTLRQTFVTILSFLTVYNIFAPILKTAPWNYVFVTIVFFVFMLFLNSREKFLLKKGVDAFSAKYLYVSIRYQKTVTLTLQMLTVVATIPFFFMAALLWFQYFLIEPVEPWRATLLIGFMGSIGLVFAYYMLFLINNPIKIDKRIIKLVGRQL